MELNKSNIKKILGIITFTVLLYVGIQRLDVVWSFLAAAFNLAFPFLLGAAIAFVLNVLMRALEQRLFDRTSKKKLAWKLKRPISLLLTLLIVFGVIFLVVFLVVPEIIKTADNVRLSMPGFFTQIETNYMALIDQYPFLEDYLRLDTLDWKEIVNNIYGFIMNSGADMLHSTFSVATSIFGGIIDFLLGFIFSIYILLQKERLGKQSKKLLYAYLPEKAVDRILSLCSMSSTIFSKFLSGQCLEAVILGLLFFVPMLILRFPYALLISILISFTALIPIFGAFIGCFIGAFLILIVDPVKALWFILMFVIIQQIEGNLIYPRVVGGSIGLPSLWVLVAVTIGGSTLGIAGMLIFIPMFSVLYTLVKDAVNTKLKKRRISPGKLQ